MARKKEVIQNEWDTAQEELTTALNSADKAVEELKITDKIVEGAQAKYDDWKKLLNEAVVKIADWKNEKDEKRLKWMKYVETQKTKVDRGYVERIKKLWTSANEVLIETGAKKALAELISQYENDSLSKLKKVTDCVRETVTAIQNQDAPTALKKHGAALNYLKGVTSYATKTGLKTSCANYARTNKVPAKEVNINDPTLKKWFEKTAAAYVLLTKKLEELEVVIGKLADELANKEPETTSTDPEYKKHLQEIQSDYKEVLAFATSGLSKTKKYQTDITKLVTIAERATAEVADKVASTALKLFSGMIGEYRAVDTHIQQTIRTSSSTITVKRKNYGITEEDQLKTLGPLMDRAFALNFQAKAACENSIDDLRDVLDDLVEKFDNEAAKSALNTVKM